jgi:hypothetical protein
MTTTTQRATWRFPVGAKAFWKARDIEVTIVRQLETPPCRYGELFFSGGVGYDCRLWTGRHIYLADRVLIEAAS